MCSNSQSLTEYHKEHQRKQDRREFDLYDLNSKKKDKPARASDGDQRQIIPSSHVHVVKSFNQEHIMGFFRLSQWLFIPPYFSKPSGSCMWLCFCMCCVPSLFCNLCMCVYIAHGCMLYVAKYIYRLDAESRELRVVVSRGPRAVARRAQRVRATRGPEAHYNA